MVELLGKYRPFNSNTLRHSSGRIFPSFSLAISLSARNSPREPRTVTASCHSSAEVDGASLVAQHHKLTHYWPHNPWHKAFLSPALCKHFSALYSACLIQATRWVNARTPLAGRVSPCGRSQWGTDSHWLNMPLFLANCLAICNAFNPSMFSSVPLQILQERGSRMWRGLCDEH